MDAWMDEQMDESSIDWMYRSVMYECSIDLILDGWTDWMYHWALVHLLSGQIVAVASLRRRCIVVKTSAVVAINRWACMTWLKASTRYFPLTLSDFFVWAGETNLDPVVAAWAVFRVPWPVVEVGDGVGRAANCERSCWDLALAWDNSGVAGDECLRFLGGILICEVKILVQLKLQASLNYEFCWLSCIYCSLS